MASHEQELEDLAERLETDRDRQYLNLRDKLTQKRKRKMDELRRKQDVDLTKEMIEQKKEMDEIRMKQVGLIGNIGFIRFWVSTRQTQKMSHVKLVEILVLSFIFIGETQ